MAVKEITQEYLKEILHYDRDSGEFIWKKRLSMRGMPGKVAGYFNNIGYKMIGINNEEYLVHRLVWLHEHGYFPNDRRMHIDHIDRNPKNNRVNNLRLVTATQNHINARLYANNTSGVRGISYNKRCKRWHAYIKDIYKKHRRLNIGYFKTKEEAIIARKNAEINYGWESFNNGETT